GILQSSNTTTTISTWDIKGCYFLNCTTPKTGTNNGSMVILFKKECVMNVERSIFKGIVTNSGVICCQPGMVTITDSKFLDNDVRVSIIYTSSTGSNIKVFRSSFEGNTTDYGLFVCMSTNGEKSISVYGCRMFGNNVRELFAIYLG